MIKAKFTNKVKEQIYIRDNYSCIICWWTNKLQFHHVYFWTESNYWKDRNEINQGVTICDTHHMECHSCKQWEWIRQKCIDYINNL